ncbi:MAG: hypothetical protein IPJ13_00825 [Saprospiraceae bacterium]|nr:hypothetical protein [Saprospiraceae bacterium]
MNKEYLNQIFNKFSQEEGSPARRYEGTGLGMTITKNDKPYGWKLRKYKVKRNRHNSNI